MSSAASSCLDKVVLPAPDGEDSTKIRPRRAIEADKFVSASLNVLNLFAHLIDDRLHRKATSRDLNVIGL